jgi:hypothetical protein
MATLHQRMVQDENQKFANRRGVVRCGPFANQI